MAKHVTMTMTERQANRLWWLLTGVIDRDSFDATVMRDLERIRERLDKACEESEANK